ncbi:MAG: hypothetical protein ACTSP4_10635 [Candidatus Hodarchaeales archaeon]
MTDPMPLQNDNKLVLNQDIQRMVLEMQELEKTVTALQRNIDLFSLQRSELLNSKETINQFGEREKGERVLVPLGSKIIIPFLLSGEEQILFRAGNDVLIPLTHADTIDKLDEQIAMLESVIKQTSERMSQIYALHQQKEAELNSMVNKG